MAISVNANYVSNAVVPPLFKLITQINAMNQSVRCEVYIIVPMYEYSLVYDIRQY